jgi:Flp pilus assembly protein TadD
MRPYLPGAKKDARNVLRAALSSAIADQTISQNPAVVIRAVHHVRPSAGGAGELYVSEHVQRVGGQFVRRATKTESSEAAATAS